MDLLRAAFGSLFFALYFSLLKGLSCYRRISFIDFWESVIILLRR